MTAPLTQRFRAVAGLGRGAAHGVRSRIAVGKRVRIGRRVRLFVDRNAAIFLGDGCELDDGVTIAAYGRGVVDLGAGVFVGHHSTIAAHAAVRIGRGTFLAELVSARDHDHDPALPPSSGALVVAEILVGEDVWIGSKVTVLRGHTIGDRAVIGANAVVASDISAGTVAVGVPARMK